MEGMAIWIALAAVFIALIPAFAGKAAKARRERAEARHRGDTSATYAGPADSGGHKPTDGGGADSGGGDGGGGGGD